MQLSGELLLGAARVAGGAGKVRAMNPATGVGAPSYTSGA